MLTIWIPLLLTGQECDNPTAQADLNANGVRARITNGGDLWWNGNDPGYAVSPGQGAPSDTSAHIVFVGGLWMAGLDAGGNIKMAAQSYGRARGLFDYSPGPLNEDGAISPNCNDWDKLFEIRRADIEAFLANYDPTSPDFTAIPLNVAGWPAMGNPLFSDIHGFALPDAPHQMGPFFDSDEDGQYDPRAGDYPLFCGDQAIWTVFNDAGLHLESGSTNPLQAEIHLLAYAFDAEDQGPLNRTTFYQYRINNKSSEDLFDFYAGHFVDSDVGCYKADGFTTSPDLNLFYTYNLGGIDDQSCRNGSNSYTTDSPVNIFQVVGSNADIGDTLLHTVGGIWGSGLWDPPAPTAAPSTMSEYYNRMNGFWNDGTPIMGFGDGFQVSDVPPTRYLFDGGQIAHHQWDYCSQDLNFPDSRIIYSTGPYNLEPAQSATFTLAVTSLFDISYDGDCPDTTAIYTTAQQIKEVYERNCAANVTVSTETFRSPEAIGLITYPNPTSGGITFRLPEEHQIDRVEILDIAGRTLTNLMANGSSQTFNLEFPAGTYLYRLTTGAGEMVVGRLVIMK